MAKTREDIQYRGHRVIANNTGAMIYPDKQKLDGEDITTVLESAKAWIDQKYTDRKAERRAPHVGTVDDYVEALTLVNPTAGKRLMLIAHSRADERTMTAKELSQAAGWKSFSSANVHYGTLGKAVAEHVGLSIEGDNNAAWTTAMATFDDATSAWQMHEEVAEAMGLLKIN